MSVMASVRMSDCGKMVLACCSRVVSGACRVEKLTTEFDRQLGVSEAKLKEVRAAVRHANKVIPASCA